jgi:hypothetical protein
MLAQIWGWRKEEVQAVAHAMTVIQDATIEEGSIRLRSPAAPKGGAEKKKPGHSAQDDGGASAVS